MKKILLLAMAVVAVGALLALADNLHRPNSRPPGEDQHFGHGGRPWDGHGHTNHFGPGGTNWFGPGRTNWFGPGLTNWFGPGHTNWFGRASQNSSRDTADPCRQTVTGSRPTAAVHCPSLLPAPILKNGSKCQAARVACGSSGRQAGGRMPTSGW